MSIEIKAVVKSFVLTIHGETVHARITESVRAAEKYEWDISHHFQLEHSSKIKKPDSLIVSSPEEALVQIEAYAERFPSGYEFPKNPKY